MTGRTRGQLLALAIVVAATGYLVVENRDQPAADFAPASNPGGGQATKSGEAAVAELRLERLKASPRELTDANRNPFRFYQPPPPPSRPTIAPPPVATAPSLPVGPPPPPPIPLKFIGLLDQSGGIKVAILSDARGNVFYGKEGAIIEGRYQLTRIGVESAELAYVDGRGRQTIRLSGQ